MARPTTKVTLRVKHRGVTPSGRLAVVEREYRDLQTYQIDSNVLTLVDVATFQLAAVDGVVLAEFNEGDPASVFMSDPSVAGGKEVQVLKGLVSTLADETSAQGGSTLNVEVSDLGWHLVNNCGPLFKSVKYLTFQQLLDLSIDPSWGFSMPVRADNDLNRRLLQGKALIQAPQTDAFVPIPPICYEAGDTVAQKLILYAQRAKQLVNVSGDGHLQFFSPNYGQQGPSGDPNSVAGVDFTIHHHREGDAQRTTNNAKSARRTRSIEGIYTDVTCVGTIVNTTTVPYAEGEQHPGTFRGYYSNPGILPFKRLLTFSDGDALTNSKKNPMATDHAVRKGQRGLFDSWQVDYAVDGHALGGVFITPDAMCGVDDSIRGLKGNFYVARRRFARALGAGTTTVVTVRKPNLLLGGSA